MTAIAENDSCCIGILQFHELKREKKGRFVRFLKVQAKHWCTHIVPHYILKNSNGRLSDFRISGLGL